MQCLPLGILQLIYSQRTSSDGSKEFGTMAALSLITTFLMLGMKIAGIVRLPTLLLYDSSCV